jgi:hypothetical protein
VEVLIAMGLGSLVLATIASLSVYGARSSIALSNYTDLDSKSRYALDVIGREIRQATAVTGYQTNASGKSLTLTNADQAATITLSYDNTAHSLVLTKSGAGPLAALTQCDRWDFSLYQRTPYGYPTNLFFFPATNSAGALDLSICKVVNMNWKCSRSILGQKVNTESVQTAQIVLRNKQ